MVGEHISALYRARKAFTETECSERLRRALMTTNKAVTEKRLRVEIAAIKEARERKEVKDVIWVSTENQLADVLTKKGVSPIRLLAALEEGRHM